MIGSFPVAYPDELLYSICARYVDRMAYSKQVSVSRELFGAPQIAAIVDLPSHITRLVDNLQANSSYTVDKIIDHHTLFPLYAEFLPAERAKRLRACMAGDQIHLIAALVGGQTQRRSNGGYLRFCPVCVEHDKECFNECYWHRVHQVPGVHVCPLHHVWLEQSSVQLQNRRQAYQFVSAETACPNAIPRALNLSDTTEQILLQIATDANFVLTKQNENLDLLRLELYLQALISKNLAVNDMRVRTPEFIKAIEDYFGHV